MDKNMINKVLYCEDELENLHVKIIEQMRDYLQSIIDNKIIYHLKLYLKHIPQLIHIRGTNE